MTAVIKEKDELLNIPRVKIFYGNKTQPIITEVNNNQKWTMFVDIEHNKGYASKFKGAGDLIKSVRFELYVGSIYFTSNFSPTFSNC